MLALDCTDTTLFGVEIVPALIKAFEWPKSMRWATWGQRWIRPLHAVLCVFGGETVPGRIDLDGGAMGFTNELGLYHAYHALRIVNVADGTNDKVWIIDRMSGKTVGEIGDNGRMAGLFHWIDAIAIDSLGNMYTGEVDTGKRVQKFKPTNGAPK